MEETGGVPLVLRRITLTKSMLIPAENLPMLGESFSFDHLALRVGGPFYSHIGLQ